MLVILSKEYHNVGTSSNRDRYGAKPNKQPTTKDHIVMIVFVNYIPENPYFQFFLNHHTEPVQMFTNLKKLTAWLIFNDFDGHS